VSHFNGPDYVPERDDERLTSQLLRVKNAMLSGDWKSLRQLESETGDPQSSISAQLRHLRKERFGSYIVEKRYAGNGLFEYRIPQEAQP
jgi:transcriptional antiterminator